MHPMSLQESGASACAVSLLDVCKGHDVGVQTVREPSLEDLIGSLSGGNQQKVVIARALSTNPKVVILDEPTRGIDAAARSDVYNIIHQLKNAGVAVLMVSSDIEEVVELADRAITVFRGRINGEFRQDEITQDVLTSASFGIVRERAVSE